MDIKIGGITPEILAEALEQARRGRLEILDKMAEALGEPRSSISAYAPRILTIRVPVDKIRDIIGPGGKMIRSIVERTGCKIDVEDDGRVSIASVDENAARKAVAIIEELTATAEMNKTYLGKVVRVVDFGAFVEILPGTDGLLHVSEMAHHRVQDVHGARSRKATRCWSRSSPSTPRARSGCRARRCWRKPKAAPLTRVRIRAAGTAGTAAPPAMVAVTAAGEDAVLPTDRDVEAPEAPAAGGDHGERRH